MTNLHPIPQEVIDLGVARAGLVRSRELSAAGVPSSRITRLISAGQLSRVTRGVLYIPQSAKVCKEQVGDNQFRRLQQSYLGVLAAGDSAAAAGQSALVIHGVPGLPKVVKPEITTHTGCTTERDQFYHNYRVPYDKSHLINGVKVVPPIVALNQAIRRLPRNNAIAVMDAMLHQHILTAEELLAVKESLAGRRGSPQVRPWFELVNSSSESPAESFARLTCQDMDCPPDAVQLEVFDSFGTMLARVDMAWRLPDGRWLLCEIDGFDFHSNREALRKDRERQNRLVMSQTILRRWSGSDAIRGFLAADVQHLLKQAGWRPHQVSARDARRLQIVAEL